MKGYKHLTNEQKQDIFQTYKETKSTRITADRLGIRIDRIRNYLKRQGIKPSGHTRNACYRNFDLVVQMAQDGHSYSKIGRVVGTNHHRVKEFLERYDIGYPGHVQTGRNNPNWKGGRMIDKSGYVLLCRPNHPSADSHGYIREHRLVMSEALGRLLLPKEVVHHIDDDYQNNSIENLRLYPTNADHLKETLKGCVPNWTEDGKKRIVQGIKRAAARRRKTTRAES